MSGYSWVRLADMTVTRGLKQAKLVNNQEMSRSLAQMLER